MTFIIELGMSSSPLKAIRVKDLKVGHYVHLPGSWSTHPFFLSHFKIKSKDQIAKIESLGYITVTYDPAKSDPSLFNEPGQSVRNAPQEKEKATSSHGLSLPWPSTVKNAALPHYQQSLQRAFNRYTGLVEESSNILSKIVEGQEEGVLLATAMATDLSKLLTRDADTAAIASIINLRQPDKAASLHPVNVLTLAMMVGRELGLSQEELSVLGTGGLIHDVGEKHTPLSALTADGPPEANESNNKSLHPQAGAEIARRVLNCSPQIVNIIEQHHERIDGSGYPKGIKGDDLDRLASIIGVVDAYEYLTNSLSRDRIAPSDALSRIYNEKGKVYPEDVVVALVRSITIYPPGSLVQLTDGSIGLVIATNSQERLKPIVAIYDHLGNGADPKMVDLRHASRLSIARTLRFDQVSDKIGNYLDPQRLTCYFVCSNSSRPNN